MRTKNIKYVSQFKKLLTFVFVTGMSVIIAYAGTDVATADAQGDQAIATDVIVDSHPQPGSAHDQSFRSIVVSLFDALSDGDELQLQVPGRADDTPCLSLRKGSTDDASIITHLWSERVLPAMGKQNTDLVGEIRRVMTETWKPERHRLVVVLLSRRLSSASTRALRDVALDARDQQSQLVIVGTEEDSDDLGLLLQAAGAGVLRFDPLSRAEPRRWIEKIRPLSAEVPATISAPTDADRTALALEQVMRDLNAQQHTILEEQRQRDEALRYQRELLEQQKKDLEEQINTVRAERNAQAEQSEADKERIANLERQLESNNSELESIRARTQQLGDQYEQPGVQPPTATANRAAAERTQPAITDFVNETLPKINHSSDLDTQQSPILSEPIHSSSPDAVNAAVPTDALESALTNSVLVESLPVSKQNTEDSWPVIRLGMLFVVLSIAVVVGCCFLRAKGRGCCVNLKWLSAPGHAWSGLALHVDPRCEAIAIPPDGAPHVVKRGTIGSQASLAVRGKGLELRDERVDSVLVTNSETIEGTRQRLRVGDSIEVRHPGGSSSRLLIGSLDRVPRQTGAIIKKCLPITVRA